jgi:DNA repair protein RadC
MATPAPTLVPADRHRERLRAWGPAALTTAELLAILLGTGSGGTGVLQLLRPGRPPVRRIWEPEDLAHLFQDRLRGVQVHEFHVLALDSQGQVL